MEDNVFIMVRVFLSSTFKDLLFERRAVREKLVSMGLDVVPTDTDGTPAEDTFQWCMDAVASSDIFILLIGKCGGSLPYGGIGLEGTQPFVFWELKASRQHTEFQFYYKLNRPFPDAHLLNLKSTEEQEYAKTLQMRDENSWIPSVYSIGREIAEIHSVKELLDKIEGDIGASSRRVGRKRLANGRFRSAICRIGKRSYPQSS